MLGWRVLWCGPGSFFFYSSVIPFLESFPLLNLVPVFTCRALHSSDHLQMTLLPGSCPLSVSSGRCRRSQPRRRSSGFHASPAPAPGSGSPCSLPFPFCLWSLAWEIFKAGPVLGLWKNISPPGCRTKGRQHSRTINQGSGAVSVCVGGKAAAPAARAEQRGLGSEEVPGDGRPRLLTARAANKGTPV